MITDLIFIIFGSLIGAIATAISALTTFIELPSSDITTALQWLFGNAWYFKGVMPVEAMFKFLANVLYFYMALFTFNIIMWIYHKFRGISPDKAND